jgi:hypothetical protein
MRDPRGSVELRLDRPVECDVARAVISRAGLAGVIESLQHPSSQADDELVGVIGVTAEIDPCLV